MGKIERIIAALAAFLTIATGAFFIYDRLKSESAAKPEASAVSPASPAGPAASAGPNADAKTAVPASAAQPAAPDVTPKPAATASAAPKPAPKLVFLCDGQQSATFAPGKNPNQALERFRNVPPTAEAIFDFSASKQSGAGEVMVHGPGGEWSAYPVAVEVAGQRSLYGATGKNAQSNGVTFAERGEVNLETFEWTSTRVIRTAAQRGPQSEVKVSGKCSVLESPKPKTSDAPPQWQIEAKFIPLPR